MKITTKNHSFSINMILLAISLLFNQAQAYEYSGGCGTLHVLVESYLYKNLKIFADGPEVTHGSYQGCQDFVIGGCHDYVFEQTSLLNGPDIILIFVERTGNKTAEIRIQQNYCFFEGGHITVQQKKGEFAYHVTEGSFGSTPGLVNITFIETW